MSSKSTISVSFSVDKGSLQLLSSSENTSIDTKVSTSAGKCMKKVVDRLTPKVQLTGVKTIQGTLRAQKKCYEMEINILGHEPIFVTLNEKFVHSLSGIPKKFPEPLPITQALKPIIPLTIPVQPLTPIWPDTITTPITIAPIQNTGTDCFMNAVIQVVMHDSLLRNAVWSVFHKKNTPEAQSLLNVMRDYPLNEVSTKNLRDLMPQGSQQGQQDASEFLQQLVNQLDPKDYPDLFCALKTTYKWENKGWFSTTTKTTSETVKEFFIPITITQQPNPVSGQGLIESFFQQKKHEGENFKDESTGNVYTPGTVQMKIVGTPKRLSFMLKRFELNKKINTPVDMPEVLTINDTLYFLKKSILHRGESRDNGHYTCLIAEEGHWTHANDAQITDEKNTKQTLQNGYLYFYEKVETE